jgi:hypothetical protein
MKYYAFIFLVLLQNIAQAQLTERYEDGLAITHPRLTLTIEQRLQGSGLGLGYFLDSTQTLPPKISNKYLSQLPAFRPILESIQTELELFKKEFSKKGDTVGVGLEYHNRLFDAQFLQDDRANFSLVGIINRMDTAYKNSENCGEVRFIYRLAYAVELPNEKEKKIVSSRLPMTINLVLHAKSKDSAMTCSEIAKRWNSFDVKGLKISEAVDKILASSGPLAPELRDRSLIKKLEINLQLSRKAAAVSPDFGGHAVYLLKVFDWDSAQQIFKPTLLENQIDRNKSEKFLAWLLDPQNAQKNIIELDRGTLQIPEEFLAERAYSIAPGGLSRAQNHVIVRPQDQKRIDQTLNSIPKDQLINIQSRDGFWRRLTDISCTGCHQTRAIGGFHFMGQDPYRWNESTSTFSGLYPGNSVVVPGSGHFFADLERRRRIQQAFIQNQDIDFSSGFSSKPMGALSSRFRGWGSHCYAGKDPSFKNWTCDEGTQCLQILDTPLNAGMGVCVSQSLKQIGDPTETGKITMTGKSWYSDIYQRTQTFPLPDKENYVNSPQSAQSGSKTGGFPGGSIRTKTCDQSIMQKHPEAKCGALPAAKSGFNACLTDPKSSFKDCIDQYSTGVGLRSCSRMNPCRDDYICAQSLTIGEQDSGVCVPPYFLFQFRVDGHPIKF